MRTFAAVAVTAPLRNTLHYRIPGRLEAFARVGVRCSVELGRRKVAGFIVEILSESEVPKPKDVLEILDAEPLLSKELINLGLWVSDYYQHPLGETLNSLFPPEARAVSSVVYTLAEGAGGACELSAAEGKLIEKAAAGIKASELSGAKAKVLSGLVEKGLLERNWRVEGPREQAKVEWLSLSEDAPPPGELPRGLKRLKELLLQLSEGPAPWQAIRSKSLGRDVLKRAVSRGWVKVDIVNDAAALPESFSLAAKGMVEKLTTGQAGSLELVEEKLEGGGFAPILLHGVTGSGKTEVYIRAVASAIAAGSSALVLVPEIALTPQLVGRFAAALGAGLAVLHSGLSRSERRLQWEKVRSGEARAVVGTRSAVFAPLVDLRLIIIDEEHDSSYKQEEGLRYNAKHVALVRASRLDCAVVLGSATPDLETLHHARSGRYLYAALPERVGSALLPSIKLVDIRQEEKRKGYGLSISEPLAHAVDKALGRGEQALLFINRRGFSPVYVCVDCGEPIRCGHCSVTLTQHGVGERARLRCHYCGVATAPPAACPACSSPELYSAGAGTQKIERIAAEVWPGAGIGRLDRDSVGNASATGLLEEFRAGSLDILIGTQMVVKGHHFPNLTVVGVLDADAGMGFPDFRATEKTFQSLTQVAGRAGRSDKPGMVLLQSRNPHHPLFKAVIEGDYEGFATEELGERQRCGFPPFSRLALLRLSSADRAAGERGAAAAARFLRSLAKDEELEILGPATAPIEKLRGRYRFQILLRCEAEAGTAPLVRLLRHFFSSSGPKMPTGVRAHADPDPVNML